MKENDKFKKLSDVPKKYTGKCFITSIHEEHIYYKGLLHNTKGPAVTTKNSKQYWHKGSLHRLDGPAVVYYDGREEFWVDGGQYQKRDYDYLNSVIVFKFKSKVLKSFPEDLKDVVFENLDIFYSSFPDEYSGLCLVWSYYGENKLCWVNKGLVHRVDGPAEFYDDYERKTWKINGKKHRIGGPAYYYLGLTEEYYIHNVKYEPNDYWKHPLNIKYKLDKIINEL